MRKTSLRIVKLGEKKYYVQVVVERPEESPRVVGDWGPFTTRKLAKLSLDRTLAGVPNGETRSTSGAKE